MTPERKKWWDSLPKEERLVRLAIVWQKDELHDHKFTFNIKNFTPLNPWQVKMAIKCIKQAIKALRKEIGMSPISYGDHWKCPRCGRAVHQDYC